MNTPATGRFQGPFDQTVNGKNEGEPQSMPMGGSNPKSSERPRDTSKSSFMDGPFGGKKPE